MCLAIPCRVVSISGSIAEIEHGSNKISIDISLVPDVKIGEYVIVHAGMAIQVYDQDSAEITIGLINDYFKKQDSE